MMGNDPKAARRIAILGTCFALLGGCLWGLSGTCSQHLLQNYHIDETWILAMRNIIAAPVLVVVCLLRPSWRPPLVKIWREPKDVAVLLLFCIAGLIFVQMTYLLAIGSSNAGTATVLQYIGPVFIVGITCVIARRLPLPKEVLALVCVLVGTFLLATHGDPTHLVLSEAGLFWGLASAGCVALYSMIPRGLMAKWGSLPITTLGVTVAAVILVVAVHPWTCVPANMDTGAWLALLGVSLLGTAGGFGFYLQGVSMIGASKGSMFASVETVSATVGAVMFLGSPFTFIDFIGFIFIMSTVFILNLGRG